MSTITVTEEVYEVRDGRTVLAAAVGDELTAEQAERLKVGADGTSTNGVGPATELKAGPNTATTSERPAKGANRETWNAYAGTLGLDGASYGTKDELIAAVDQAEGQ